MLPMISLDAINFLPSVNRLFVLRVDVLRTAQSDYKRLFLNIAALLRWINQVRWLLSNSKVLYTQKTGLINNLGELR